MERRFHRRHSKQGGSHPGKRAGPDWPQVYQLEKFPENPLDTAYWFYMDEEEAIQRRAILRVLRQACEFKPGTLFYIGGVIDYHF